ncbi:TPA: glycosyltransferase family 2 protein [Campylobacter coli]|nr:glycosyltransferase family 2 protein [Campylobacter coli]
MQEVILNTKTVGVVIPIYNVEKYLRECLDSVINQSYTNLEIILVNDGSTDENSLNIAKEYTLKDKRITLFDKKNGGQSTARNVGIEYFSGEYKLKNKTQSIKENSLIEFNIEGNNPYEIYTVYKSYKAFNDEKDLTKFTYPIIDYIIFLDSDDYWELNCIEECVPRMDGVDVVWFDVRTVLDGVSHSDWKSNIKWLNFSQECILDRNDWLKRMYDYKMRWFYFSVMGMINFNFLKKIKLKFINYIVQEDDHFGILLFSQIKYCYILPNELYLYRIRSNSTMAYDVKINHDSIPSFFKKYLIEFGNEATITKHYFHISSHVQTCMALLEFFIEQNDDILTKSLFKYLLPTYIKNAYEIIHFSKDPLGLLPNIKIIKELMEQYNIKPHGIEFRFKNELPYAIGSTILQNCKSFKKICKLPRQIYKILKQNKINQKLFKARVVEHPYAVLPELYKYEDIAKIDRLKEHLSYKIGLAFLKGHKYRYIGGYFVFLFKILKPSINYYKINQNKVTVNQDAFYINVEKTLTNINRELYHLRILFEKKYNNSKYKELNQINNKSPSFAFYLNFFKNIFPKKCILIDTNNVYLKNYSFLNKFENITICAFESDYFKFSILKKENLDKIKLFNYSLGCETVSRQVYLEDELYQKDLFSLSNFKKLLITRLILLKNITDFLETELILNDYEYSILHLVLDHDGFDMINYIIDTKLYLKLSYIICDINEAYYKEMYVDLLKDKLRNDNIFNIIVIY